MAITAKKSFTLKKKDLQTSKVPAVGFRKVVAYHKATAGNRSINLAALVMPTEMSSAGYSQASTTDLIAADLTFYRDNLALISSARGFLQPGLSYSIASNTNIVFSDSFGLALADEIFTIIIDPVAKSGVEFVDGVATPATGVLTAGQTDFNTGWLFEVNKYPTTQMGAVQVFLDGVLQSRNAANATASVTADGNYEEVASSGAYGTIIRFNIVDSVNARDVKVIPVGMMLNRPDGTVRAEIQRQQGQIDKLVEVLSDVSGTPESTFQAAPNDVNLKTFGDRVLGLESTPGFPKLATASVEGAVKSASTPGAPNLATSGLVNCSAVTIANVGYVELGNFVILTFETRFTITSTGNFSFNITLPVNATANGAGGGAGYARNGANNARFSCRVATSTTIELFGDGTASTYADTLVTLMYRKN